MIITMLQVLDGKTAPEAMIVEILEIVTIFICAGTRRWLRNEERTAVDNGMFYGKESRFSGVPAALRQYLKEFRDGGVMTIVLF